MKMREAVCYGSLCRVDDPTYGVCHVIGIVTKAPPTRGDVTFDRLESRSHSANTDYKSVPHPKKARGVRQKASGKKFPER